MYTQVFVKEETQMIPKKEKCLIELPATQNWRKSFEVFREFFLHVIFL